MIILQIMKILILKEEKYDKCIEEKEKNNFCSKISVVVDFRRFWRIHSIHVL